MVILLSCIIRIFHMTDKKLNVLYIFPTSKKRKNGGFRHVMISCAKACHTYHVLMTTRKKTGTVTEKIGHNLTLEPTNSRSKPGTLFKSILIGLQVLRKFDKNHPSVITVFQPFAGGLIAFIISRLTGTPLNVELRTDYFSEPYSSHTYWSNKRNRLTSRVRYLFAQWLLRRADGVLSVAGGRMSKSLVDFGVKPERIHILRTAVNIADFTPTSTREFDKKTLEIISITRFVPQKNLPLLIEAFDLAAGRIPNLKLTLVGVGSTGERLSSILSKTKNKEKITVLPWSNDVPTLLKEADIFALSSDYEGCARVITEAMASGLPIVTTDVSGIGDVCQPNEHALVTPIKDEEAFAEALVTLAKNKEMRQRFSANSLATTKSSYQTLPEYVASWSSILNQAAMK